MDKEIKTFAGIFYADNDYEKAVYLKKYYDYNLIMAVGTTMMGLMAEGFEAISMTAMNLYPEMFVELYDMLKDYRMREAFMLKEKLFDHIFEFYKYEKDMDYVSIMKMEFSKMNTSMKMGPIRQPKMSMKMFMKTMRY